MYAIRHYITASGKSVFESWLTSLNDEKAQARIAARIARLAAGNFGDCKALAEGVWELRIDHGSGYRVYYTILDRSHVLLLCGGDKRTQARDIKQAVAYWKDYEQRTGKS
jgi:putative addiction module killer protein